MVLTTKLKRIRRERLLLFVWIGLISLLLSAAVGGQALDRPAKNAPRKETQQRPAANDRAAQQRPEQGESLGPPGRPFFTRLQILQFLDLSPEQQSKIHDLRDTLGSQLQGLRERQEERRDALNHAVYADSIDEKRIDELTAGLRDAQAQILQIETRLEIAFRGILTAEQLQRLRDLQADEMKIRQLQREVNRRQRALRQKVKATRSAGSQPPDRP